MQKKILFIIVILIILMNISIGCSTNQKKIEETNSDFNFSYTFDKVESQDKTKILKWIKDKKIDLSLKIYEINDKINNRYLLYVYSQKYNYATIEQNGKKIIITVSKSKLVTTEDLLLKIKFNPNKIEGFQLNEK